MIGHICRVSGGAAALITGIPKDVHASNTRMNKAAISVLT